MNKPKDIFRRLRGNLDDEGVKYLIKSAFTDSDVRNLANKCELKHNGVRTCAIDPDELRTELAEKFFQDAGKGITICKYLLKKVEDILPDISPIAPNEIRLKYDPERFAARDDIEIVGAVIAMFGDPRPDIQAYSAEFLEEVLKHLSAREEERSSPEKDPEPEGSDVLSSNLFEELSGLSDPEILRTAMNLFDRPKEMETDELANARRSLIAAAGLLRHSYQQFLQTLEKIQDEIAVEKQREEVLIEKLDRLQNQLKLQRQKTNEIAKQKAELSRQLAGLRDKYNSLAHEREQIVRLTAQIHDLERENRKLEHRIAELESALADYQAIKEENSRYAVITKTLRDQIDGDKSKYEAKIEALNSQIEVLQAQRDELREELKRRREESQKTDSTGAKPRGEKPHVAIFVDVQNMFYAAKERYDGKLDYAKLLDIVTQDRIRTAAFAYVVHNPDIDQSSFISFLEHQGYSVRSKTLTVRSDGSAKGNWDVGMTLDIISMIDEVDIVALVSGDGDFCPLVGHLQKHGIEVEVFGFDRNTSMELKQVADRFYPISGDMILV